MSPPPSEDAARFSVVICSDGRAAALDKTLRCLELLDYREFEVCVVSGPTPDGTRDVIADWEGRVKSAACPARNLSQARNMGIALSAGDIVAFIDDDALAEPEWLRDLAAAYRDSAVGGAGGIVYDHTGVRPQFLYSSANRLGQADWTRQTPAAAFNFPLSFNFPYLQGTNCSFRRAALVDAGGFDEEFDYYLDETDLCCRLVDVGLQLRQLPDAIVHHAHLPSAIRDEQRITVDRFSLIKNKIYFSLVNNKGHYGVEVAVQDAMAFVALHEADIAAHVREGRLPQSALQRLREDVERAWPIGLARGLSGERRLMAPATLALPAAPFLGFPTVAAVDKRRTFCLVSQEYPPDRTGGIGRYFHQMARGIASRGHHVHVLSAASEHDSIAFEDGVWVHRLLTKAIGGLEAFGRPLPDPVWHRSATAAAEIARIAAKRPVACVYAPIWDCEGVAILAGGHWPLVIGLQTPLRIWLDSQPEKVADMTFMADFANPMLELETWLLEWCDGVHAISQAIVREIEHRYRVTIGGERLAMIPLGLEDWRALPWIAPSDGDGRGLSILFVGRLERRKGIDLLLAAGARLLARHATLRIDVVGNDAIPGPDGPTYRERFESEPSVAAVRERIAFHSEVDEARLRGFYRACDIVAAPSRFESFGLMAVEAMMLGRPVVGSRTGGMVEVIEDGVTGLLAEPGDAASLERCLEQLIVDADLRRRLGDAGRQRYERLFRPDAMIGSIIDFMLERAAARASRHGSDDGRSMRAIAP